jgi:ATP-binding cassette subfamily B protein
MIIAPSTAILGRYWRESRLLLAGVMLIVVAAAVSAIAAPYVFSRLIDTLQTGTWPETMLWAFVGYAVLLGLSTALQSVVQYMALMSSQNLGFIAGTSFFERILKKTIAFFIEHNPAEIQSAQSRGQRAIDIVVQLGIIVFIPGLVQISMTVAVLGATINLEIVLIVLAYGLGFIVFTYFANTWTRPFLDAAIEASQENAKFVGNAVNAMETLRYFGGDRWIATRFADKAAEVRQGWARFSMHRIGYAAVYGAGLAVQLGVTFAVLLPRYRLGELSVGDIVLFNALLLQLNQPFEMIGSAIDSLLRSYVDFKPFARMWAAEEEPDMPALPGGAGGRGRLAFEAVSFAYGDAPVVADVSFVAERGRITFLTGETGSGKSTLFKLALKALEPQSGRVSVDGVDLSEVARAHWYQQVGVVPQEIMLLNDTLAANIVLGRALDQDRLRAAAAKASILEFIDGLDSGFDTSIGERGLKLSGGERQRVAIARALYADPKFLFLDEASSALDEATEAQIMAELRKLDDTVTIIAITHRKAVIGAGDMVVTLEAGRASAQAP